MRHGGQEWVFREVWWSRLVDAPLYNPLIGWTFIRALTHFGRLAVFTFEKSLFPALLGVTPILLLLGLTITVSLFLFILLVAIVAVLPFAAAAIMLGPLVRYIGPRLRTALSLGVAIGSVLVTISWILSLLNIKAADFLSANIVELGLRHQVSDNLHHCPYRGN